ncbi:MAG: flagellar assembly protein FliH [Frankiales bacterium]|nr:flagellar assembly protein FliH [Frankiales bacterium]MDQ1690915.1 flagellar assembly protein FliH [Pseudonocardiales bacterium]
MPESIDFDLLTPSSIPSDYLDLTRSSAAAVGYARGWAQGVHDARQAMAALDAEALKSAAEARQDAQAALRSVLETLCAAAGQLESATGEAAQLAEDTIVQAAVDLAEGLLGRELRDVDAATQNALARALRLAPEDRPLTVWLNAEVYAGLAADGLQELLRSVAEASGRSVTFEPDATLAIGDAVTRSGASTIDARLSEGLRRVRERLTT